MPADITLDSYPGAYGQVLTNLIFNAVTHGFTDAPGGHVLIKARRLGMEQVEITFSDDGSGIPEDVQRHVFDPFFTTRRAQGSTGLGLYIVHNLVTQQLGGTIALVSAPGKGTAICMTISTACSGRAELASSSTSETALRSGPTKLAVKRQGYSAASMGVTRLAARAAFAAAFFCFSCASSARIWRQALLHLIREHILCRTLAFERNSGAIAPSVRTPLKAARNPANGLVSIASAAVAS